MMAFKTLTTRSLTIFLVFGLTVWDTTNASPLPLVHGDHTTMSPKLVDLRMLVTGARNDANHIFSVNCQEMMDPIICTMLGSTGKNSQEVSQYPHFVVNQTETLDNMLEDMNEVCVGFQHLLDKFSADVAQQPGLSHLCEDLVLLRDVSLGSIRAKIMDMKPDMKIVDSSDDIDTSPDISKRNIRNLLIVAQMTTEMNNMMSALASNL